MKLLVQSVAELGALFAAWHYGGWMCLAFVAAGWWTSNLIKRFWT